MSNVNATTSTNPDDIWCFEFKTSESGFQYYVEVVHTHKHHYTGELMRYVRMDTVSFGKSESFYDFLDEEEWAKILSERVVQ